MKRNQYRHEYQGTCRWTNDVVVINVDRIIVGEHKFTSSSRRTKKRNFFNFSSFFFTFTKKAARKKGEKEDSQRQEVARQEAATPQPCHWIRISKSLISTGFSSRVSSFSSSGKKRIKETPLSKRRGWERRILAIGRVFFPLFSFLFFFFLIRGQVH